MRFINDYGLYLLIMSALLYGACINHPKPKNTIDLTPVIELALYDRGSVEDYEVPLKMILQQHDSTEIPSLNLTAHIFIWDGETGGPFKRIFSFCRDTGDKFQRNFFYEGEYHMSRMASQEYITEGTRIPLGLQLTQLCYDLGPEVYLNKDRMKDLLDTVMVKLLRCPPISVRYIDSLKISTAVTQYDPISQKELIGSLDSIKLEISENKNPYLTFFRGELTNGIWKATIRQYDHTGRNCIDLKYLNGKFAYTTWM